MNDLFGGATLAPDVLYRPGLYAKDFTLESLKAEIPLQQFEASMYGKTFSAPRLECWFGSKPYAFGGRVVDPSPWGRLLSDLKQRVEIFVGQDFDSCFANYYRDGSDCIDWHADDDSWIGPWIASVTFGAARKFVLKSNSIKPNASAAARFEWMLGDGDLLVMRPGTQQAFKHSVPRTKKSVGPRLNLTFRQTVKA